MPPVWRMCIYITWGMMNVSECRRIFSNRKRLVLMLCIPLICVAVFFYQKNMDAMLADPAEYRALIEQWRDSTPDEILADLDSQPMFSENEMRLREQARYLLEYPGYLEQVRQQADRMQHTTIFGSDPNSFVYRNILKTAEDFAGCSADGIRLGYDRPIEEWLAFALSDWAFLAAVVLLVMSFLEEREKGLLAVIRSCAAGRTKLPIVRLAILLGYIGVMTFLIYYMPLLLGGGLEDLTRPVQSIAVFQKCTLQLSVSSYLASFFLLKTACGFGIGVLLWLLLSFLGQIQLRWVIAAAGLGAEYLLYQYTPAQSFLSLFRHVNVFSYVFTSRLYTEYVNIDLFTFPVGKRELLVGLLLICAVILSVLLVVVLPRRYPFGNRDLLGRLLLLWNRVGDTLRFKLSMVGFERYKLLFLTVGGLMIVLGVLLSRNLPFNSGAYDRLEDSLYRQYLAQIQGPVTQDTYTYVAEAKAALDNSEMNTAEYETALSRLEETIRRLPQGAWLVDEGVFMNIYGPDAWFTQRNTAFTAMLILALCLSPLFTGDQIEDLRRILRSTPRGRGSLFAAKYAVALGVTAVVWGATFAREWYYAAQRMGAAVLSAPCGSITMLRMFSGTVRGALAALYLSKAAVLLQMTHLIVLIGVYSDRYEKALAWSGLVLLPAAAYRFGVDSLEWVTPCALLADGNILSGRRTLLLFGVWTVLSLIALIWGGRKWCNTV